MGPGGKKRGDNWLTHTLGLGGKLPSSVRGEGVGRRVKPFIFTNSGGEEGTEKVYQGNFTRVRTALARGGGKRKGAI